MTEPCSDLVSFADGELDAKRAQAFRSHLPTCAACRTGLLEAVQLDARLSTLSPAGLLPGPPSAPSLVSPPVPPTLPPPKPRRRLAAWGGGALAPIAAMAAYLIYASGGRVPPNAFAELTTRPYEVRLAYADAAAYRPAREQMRGAGGPASESIPYDALGAFQKHHDDYALAIARAINGEKLTEVAAQLGALPQTPAIRSDRAAIELLTTSNDNAEPILTELEALQTSDDPAVARAARWNHALLLSRLELPLSAAQAFRAIAADNEPGWAYEAGKRAEPAELRGKDFQARWKIASQAGKALLKDGAPVPVEIVKAFPGLMRRYLYDAVRTAPSRERVLALTAMATELDRAGEPREPHLLRDHVARIAKRDFRIRAPLAAAYARLLQGEKLTADEQRALTASSAPGDASDIVMGAMNELEVVPDHLDAFRRMTKQAADPWFEVVLARAEATADTQRGDWLGAEARLRQGEKLCTPAVTFQCLGLERQLGKLYQDLHRIHDALTVLHAAVRSARSIGERGQYTQLLLRLADVERFNSSTATARAYTGEVLLLIDSCEYKRLGHVLLAGAAVLDVDGRAARQHLEQALQCGAPDLRAANLLTDIARLDPQPGDLAQLQTWLHALPGRASTAPAAHVLSDEIEGRLLVERDRGAGRALLERAIAAADALPHEVDADKARAGAYSVLAFDAARQDDSARVLTLVAQDLGRSPPAACAVAMVAEDERAVAVVRDAGGRDRIAYDAKRNRHSEPWIVSENLAQGLASCVHIQVMAPAALQGQPRVLPARMSWSYAADSRHRPSPGNSPAEARALIVANVTPPAYLQLAALQDPADPDPSATRLSGPDATPSRVLTEMARASEIQFHTHALMDVGISDASHLVLSPEADGRYALTAEAIRSVELRSHPVVVLAACHSAQGARYQHEPWSLPDAFLAAGARAVFAAATDVPDREAGPFFARVLARVRAGADPALALRDERIAKLASQPSSWVADVILFE